MSKTSGKRAKRIALGSLGAAVFVSFLATSNFAALWARPAAAGPAVPGARAAANSTGRPNFVVILTDDMDAASLQYMPRTRALIGGCGATFNNMFVVNPICTPSNVSILTGQYSHNTQILHNPPPLGGFQKFIATGGEASNLATWLHDDGYLTGRVGKYLIGYPVGSTHVPPGWDDWHCFYEGFTPYFNYFLNENGAVVPYGAAETDYITDVLAGRAEKFIEIAAQEDERPFFLFFAPNAPHAGEGRNGPPTPAPRHLGSFSGVTAPRTPSFNEEDVSDKPPAVRNLPLLTSSRIEAIDKEFQARVESLQAVDEAVHRIVVKLEELGELENTYIFFTSDNGYHLGQHRLFGGKGEAYEEDIRVPLLVRGPGIPAGVSLDHFALNIDLAPTITHLAGTVPGRAMDGLSLAPLMVRNTPAPQNWRHDFLVEIYRAPGQPGMPVLALRTRHELYTEHADGFVELYDIREDPFQLENLAETADAGYLKKLSRRLAELAGCSGQGCR
ncbi:MAG TPA: sulfatase [Planctomycetia bacterium]|nr:sulfatase [Planctomycetia bacterium]